MNQQSIDSSTKHKHTTFFSTNYFCNMFNVNITGTMHGATGTLLIPQHLHASAVNFYKSRLYARNITPPGKRYVLLESSFGFRVKVDKSTSRSTGGNVRLALRSSSDRKRIARSVSANGRYSERGSTYVCVDPYGVTWTIRST